MENFKIEKISFTYRGKKLNMVSVSLFRVPNCSLTYKSVSLWYNKKIFFLKERLPLWGLYFYLPLYKTTVTFDTKKAFLFVICIKDLECLLNVNLLIRMCTECKSFGKSFLRLRHFDIEDMDKVSVKSLKTKVILRK